MRTVRLSALTRTAAIGALGVVLLASPGSSAVAAEAPVTPTLELSGAPLVHVFDTSLPGASVEGVWELTARGDARFVYEGAFTAVDPLSPTLAQSLAVEFGVLDASGDVERWAPAGTLAEPLPYTAAVGTSGTTGPSETVVRVRVTLTDTGALPRGEPQTVTAVFAVSYLSSPTQPSGPAGTAGTAGTAQRAEPRASSPVPDVLAATGLELLAPAALAVGLLLVGARTRRRDRRAARGSPGGRRDGRPRPRQTDAPHLVPRTGQG